MREGHTHTHIYIDIDRQTDTRIQQTTLLNVKVIEIYLQWQKWQQTATQQTAEFDVLK